MNRALAYALVLLLLLSNVALGQKSSFSGGSRPAPSIPSRPSSSFSGGSRPAPSIPSRPSSSFSGGSRPTPSAPSRPSSSFSGGSRPTPSAPSRPSSSFSGGSKPAPSTPSKPPSSFSGGSARSSEPSPVAPKASSSFSGGSSKPQTASGTTKPSSAFSGGSSSTSRAKSDITSTPRKIGFGGSEFDTSAANASRAEESRSNYEKQNKPEPVADSKPSANTKPETVARTPSRAERQEERRRVFYNDYYSRPVVNYNDQYHGLWNYWLMSQTLDNMALWTYHHRSNMDPARLEHLYSQNAELKARVAALESKKTPVDPNWTPPNVDKEMQFKQSPEPEESNMLPTILIILAVAGFGYIIYHLVFVKRYQY